MNHMVEIAKRKEGPGAYLYDMNQGLYMFGMENREPIPCAPWSIMQEDKQGNLVWASHSIYGWKSKANHLANIALKEFGARGKVDTRTANPHWWLTKSNKALAVSILIPPFLFGGILVGLGVLFTIESILYRDVSEYLKVKDPDMVEWAEFMRTAQSKAIAMGLVCFITAIIYTIMLGSMLVMLFG